MSNSTSDQVEQIAIICIDVFSILTFCCSLFALYNICKVYIILNKSKSDNPNPTNPIQQLDRV